MQVGEYYCSMFCDSRGVLVLPCPRKCLHIAYDVYCLCKLLVCADVEMNPGPRSDESDSLSAEESTHEMLKQILEGQKVLTSEVAAL